VGRKLVEVRKKKEKHFEISLSFCLNVARGCFSWTR
jgi:hypothetical protein